MRIQQKKKLALVLSGGGIKAAAFHIGVCLALREKGFHFAGGKKDQLNFENPVAPLTFRLYVGSSAGAMVSTFLANGYSLEDMIDAFTSGAGIDSVLPNRGRTTSAGQSLKPISYRDIFALNFKAANPKTFLNNLFRSPSSTGGLETLLKKGFHLNGLFSMKNIEKYLRTSALIENDFSKLGVELYIVATQLNHSRKVIFGNFAEPMKERSIQYANFASISDAVAASASLPPFFSPYPIRNENGKEIYFFDGEIRDTLSTHLAADHGADLVVASYSIQPYHYNEEMGSLHKYGIPVIFNQALYQLVQQKIARHIEYQKEVKSLINAVDGYLKEAEVAPQHRLKLLEILESRTHYKPNVDYIYIHPQPEDHEFFFADHFSLNPKILENMVKTGFKNAMAVMRPLMP